MRPELLTRRRVLRLTLERYVEADRKWQNACLEMKNWFPPGALPYRGAIGNPGSKLRKIYDSRIRALILFEAAHVKFERAKKRQAGGHGRHSSGTTFAMGKSIAQ